jgi:hypothetical protein
MRSLLLALLAMLSTAVSAQAALLTIGFEGTVTSYANLHGVLPGTLIPGVSGAAFTAYYTIDLDTPGTLAVGDTAHAGADGLPALATYEGAVVAFGFSVLGMDFTQVAPPTSVVASERNSWEFDARYTVSGQGSIARSDGTSAQGAMFLQLWEWGTDAALLADDPIAYVPELGRFDETAVKIQYTAMDFIRGNVTRAYEVPQPVPEPATLALVTVGLAGCLRRRRAS